MPKVSVCIPTYNAAPYIEEAVRSVLGQTYRDFELLISDNCSTDGTGAILARLAEADPRIRYERNPANLGSGPNFNKLLAQASGEYINVFHADDVMLPRNIEAKVAMLDRHPGAGLASSATISIDSDGKPLSRDNWTYDRDWVLPARAWLLQNLGALNPLCGTFAFMRRTTLERVGPFNLAYSYAGDYDMWLRFSLVSDTLLMKEVLGYYRRHSDSDSHRFNQAARFSDTCGLWSGLLDALALPPPQLREAEARIAARLFDTIRDQARMGNIDEAAALIPLLQQWRDGVAEGPELPRRKLEEALVETQQEVLRLRLDTLRLGIELETKNRAIEKLRRRQTRGG